MMGLTDRLMVIKWGPSALFGSDILPDLHCLSANRLRKVFPSVTFWGVIYLARNFRRALLLSVGG